MATRTRIDLHLHSRASTDSGSWFLNRAVLPESYTEPEAAYTGVKRHGIDLVTLTDHNTISGALEIAHHPDVVIGVEVTTEVPEDRVPLHVLVRGLDEALWGDMDRLRGNFYELLDYIDIAGLPCALARPWSSPTPSAGSTGSPARCAASPPTRVPIRAPVGAALLDSLDLYLEHGGSYDATAAALNVHRSTLRYRLKRIAEVSGHDLADPETVFNLELAPGRAGSGAPCARRAEHLGHGLSERPDRVSRQVRTAVAQSLGDPSL